MKKILLIIAFTVLIILLMYSSKANVKPENYQPIKIREVFSGLITRDKDDRVYAGQIKSEAGLAEFQKTYGVTLHGLTVDFKKQMLIFGITDNLSTRAFQLLKHKYLRSLTLDYADTGIVYDLVKPDEGKKHSHIQSLYLEKN